MPGEKTPDDLERSNQRRKAIHKHDSTWSDPSTSDNDPDYVPGRRLPKISKNVASASISAADLDVCERCPYGGRCPDMPKRALQAHKEMYHFSCNACREIFAQIDLDNHERDTSHAHTRWNLLPLDPGAKTPPWNRNRSNFSAQGYYLATEYAQKLAPGEVRSLLQVREQVNQTMLWVSVEGSYEVERTHLQHCYSVENLVARVAETAKVDPEKVELLHIGLPIDFDYDVELGDWLVIEANNNDAFKEFIGRIEGAWRERDGKPRLLLFFCKVFLLEH